MTYPSGSNAPNKTLLRDWGITIGLLFVGTVLSALLLLLDHTGGFVSMIFVLMVVLIARFTNGYIYGVVSSFVSVFCVNYIFTYPYWQLNFTISGYPLTFLSMLSVSLIVSTLTSRVKQQEQMRMDIERETMRANLLRAVSHDLRTPLTSIIGSTSAILENEQVLTQQQKNTLLHGVIDEAQWLIRMVENLLSITRMGDTAARIDKDIEVAEEILSSVSGKFQKRFPDISLKLSISPEPIFVPMDAILIEQVLMNLLENAVYHGHCTVINLAVTSQGNFAQFTVSDNGCGISREILPTIFTPSKHSGSYSNDKRRNMGIGLSVCYSIVHAHGGAMTASNRSDGGAEFQFTLPMEEISKEEFDLEDQR